MKHVIKLLKGVALIVCMWLFLAVCLYLSKMDIEIEKPAIKIFSITSQKVGDHCLLHISRDVVINTDEVWAIHNSWIEGTSIILLSDGREIKIKPMISTGYLLSLMHIPCDGGSTV